MPSVEAEFSVRLHIRCCGGGTAKSPQVWLMWNFKEAQLPHYQPVKISLSVITQHEYYIDICVISAFFKNPVTNDALQGWPGVSNCSEISGTKLSGNYLLLTKHVTEILSAHGVWALLWFPQIEPYKGLCPVCTLSASDELRLSRSLWVSKSQ